MTKLGTITQTAFITRDIRKSIDYFVDHLGIGPWFMIERAVFSNLMYCGKPVAVDLTTAFATVRGMEFELMQPNSSSPSMWTDALGKDVLRERFHHWCIWPQDYDQALTEALALGYTPLQEGATPRGRFVYLDPRDSADAILEITESTPPRRAFQKLVADAGRDWDGRTRVITEWSAPEID